MKKLAIADRAGRIGGRAEAAAGAGDQKFHDRAGFDQPMAVHLHHRRAAERMDGAQRGGRTHGARIALVAAHLIGFAKLLQQPEDSLRPAILQMMDDDGHVGSLAGARCAFANASAAPPPCQGERAGANPASWAIAEPKPRL